MRERDCLDVGGDIFARLLGTHGTLGDGDRRENQA